MNPTHLSLCINRKMLTCEQALAHKLLCGIASPISCYPSSKQYPTNVAYSICSQALNTNIDNVDKSVFSNCVKYSFFYKKNNFNYIHPQKNHYILMYYSLKGKKRYKL